MSFGFSIRAMYGFKKMVRAPPPKQKQKKKQSMAWQRLRPSFVYSLQCGYIVAVVLLERAAGRTRNTSIITFPVLK